MTNKALRKRLNKIFSVKQESRIISECIGQPDGSCMISISLVQELHSKERKQEEYVN
jgi:hypothetical protein